MVIIIHIKKSSLVKNYCKSCKHANFLKLFGFFKFLGNKSAKQDLGKPIISNLSENFYPKPKLSIVRYYINNKKIKIKNHTFKVKICF